MTTRPAWPSRLSLSRLLPLLGLLAGCSTRVVDLPLPEAGQPGSADAGKCEMIKRADGSLCEICVGPDGQVSTGTCQTLPDAGPGMGSGVSPSPQCKVIPTMDTRCLLCADGTTGASYMPCLKCEAPIMTSAQGDSCRTCIWNDLAVTRCLQCFTADGTTTSDDCDTLRPEKLASP